MTLAKPQKTIIICSAFISGIGFSMLNSIPIFIILSFALISLFAYKKVFSLKFSAVCLFIITFSLFYYGYKAPKPDELSKISPANVYLKGRVISEPELKSANRTKFEFSTSAYALKKNEWKPLKAKTLVTIYDKDNKFKEILIGDALEANGYVKVPFEATNPGQFDYRKYLKNKEIFTLTSIKNNGFEIIEHPKSGKWFLIQKLNKIKNKIIFENRKYIKSPQLEILEGMVFGDFAVPVPDEIKQEFIKSGLLHLLAASGMNVGFIFAFVFFIASRLKMPYNPKIILSMFVVAFYAVMTGLPPSVTRAAVMMEFLLLGKLLDRKSDNTTLLIFVCTIMLLINPLLLANVSFQLSFLTAFGLLMCTETLIQKTKPVPEALSGIVLIPFIAQIWASPIQLFYFNNFSTYALLANIVVTPFVAVVTFLGFIGNIFCFIPLIGGSLCMLFDKIAEPFINIILFVSGFVSKLPNSLYYFAKPDIPAITVFYGFIISLLFTIKKDFSSKKTNIATIILFSILLIFVFQGNFNKKLEIVFFDVGQGDAIFIHTPENKNILVDTGPSGKFLPARSIILSYLRSRGINKLNTLVLTHSDSDHVAGTIELLKNIHIDNVFHNQIDNHSKLSRKINRYFKENNIINSVLSGGESINPDKNVFIRVIRTNKRNKNSENEDCIVLYIRYKKFSSLLMADCEAESIHDIKKYVKYPVNIIKVGHHGSFNATNNAYLSYLKPQLAVISVGKRGYKYGHPNKQVLENLKEHNIITLRTDKNHAITINSDGENFTYKTYK